MSKASTPPASHYKYSHSADVSHENGSISASTNTLTHLECIYSTTGADTPAGNALSNYSAKLQPLSIHQTAQHLRKRIQFAALKVTYGWENLSLSKIRRILEQAEIEARLNYGTVAAATDLVLTNDWISTNPKVPFMAQATTDPANSMRAMPSNDAVSSLYSNVAASTKKHDHEPVASFFFGDTFSKPLLSVPEELLTAADIQAKMTYSTNTADTCMSVASNSITTTQSKNSKRGLGNNLQDTESRMRVRKSPISPTLSGISPILQQQTGQSPLYQPIQTRFVRDIRNLSLASLQQLRSVVSSFEPGPLSAVSYDAFPTTSHAFNFQLPVSQPSPQLIAPNADSPRSFYDTNTTDCYSACTTSTPNFQSEMGVLIDSHGISGSRYGGTPISVPITTSADELETGSSQSQTLSTRSFPCTTDSLKLKASVSELQAVYSSSDSHHDAFTKNSQTRGTMPLPLLFQHQQSHDNQLQRMLEIPFAQPQSHMVSNKPFFVPPKKFTSHIQDHSSTLSQYQQQNSQQLLQQMQQQMNMTISPMEANLRYQRSFSMPNLVREAMNVPHTTFSITDNVGAGLHSTDHFSTMRHTLPDTFEVDAGSNDVTCQSYPLKMQLQTSNTDLQASSLISMHANPWTHGNVNMIPSAVLSVPACNIYGGMIGTPLQDLHTSVLSQQQFQQQWPQASLCSGASLHSLSQQHCVGSTQPSIQSCPIQYDSTSSISNNDGSASCGWTIDGDSRFIASSLPFSNVLYSHPHSMQLSQTHPCVVSRDRINTLSGVGSMDTWFDMSGGEGASKEGNGHN
ncbi:hypothetical protein BDV3_001228 [Batrachochytrium dendrobatidis]